MKHRLTYDEFSARAEKVIGTRRWKSRFCRISGYSRSQLYRWKAGWHPVPHPAAAILALLNAMPRSQRDEFADFKAFDAFARSGPKGR